MPSQTPSADMPANDRAAASDVPAWLAPALRPVPGAMPVRQGTVDADAWIDDATHLKSHGARLVALWAEDRRNLGAGHAVLAAYACDTGLLCLDLPIDARQERPGYPDLSGIFPAAARMQRAIADLNGLVAQDCIDTRAWVRHAGWPADYFPLRREPTGRERFTPADAPYDFVRVEGDGVHEIPVGPVHAGIIEPGHFRFSVVGEKVLRLEERLGYVHRGVEKRFEGLNPAEGAVLAARVSGDTTVGFSWAYAMAVESALGIEVSERAAALRAIGLERERIANHLADLGALGNDAGFALGQAHFSSIRERWMRAHAQALGHRFLMDWVVPGGVSCDLSKHDASAWHAQLGRLGDEVGALRAIYDEHAGLQDRFTTTGRLTTEWARTLGVTGFAARASGLPLDLRARFGPAPYPGLMTKIALARGGDVAARVAVRFDEIDSSRRALERLLSTLPPGPYRSALGQAPASRLGYGWIEAWRGEVFVAMALDERGLIRRVHCHDPSWQLWPALEQAVPGNIVPDFPLINKSFNLSYAGHDL